MSELVLDRRLKTKNNRVVSQLLIKWSGLPLDLATWEDEDYIQPLLKTATSCGQVVIQGVGNVTASSSTSAAVDLAPEADRPKLAKKPNKVVTMSDWVIYLGPCNGRVLLSTCDA